MEALSCACVSETERMDIYIRSLFSIVPHVPLLCCGERERERERDHGGGNAGSALLGGKEGEEERRRGERGRATASIHMFRDEWRGAEQCGKTEAVTPGEGKSCILSLPFSVMTAHSNQPNYCQMIFIKTQGYPVSTAGYSSFQQVEIKKK